MHAMYLIQFCKIGEGVSEQILNGTSAQAITVPFIMVHAGKYATEDKLTNQEQTLQCAKTKDNPEKSK